MPGKKAKINIGPLCVFLSGVCFAIGGLCVKLIPWGAFAINGARSFIAVLMIGIFLAVTRYKLVFSRPVFLGALAISATNILYVLANKLTTAGNTIILQFTAPIFVIIFSAIIFKKKPSQMDIVAVALVFTGVIMFFVDGLSTGNMLGNALALLSGVTYSGVFMMGASEKSDTMSSTFFGMCLNVIICFPFVFGEDFSAMTGGTWAALLALGTVQLGLAYMLLSKGLKTTPPVSASLISGIEPILNPLLVAVFYGETLSTLSLIGAAIVLVTVVFYNVRKASEPAEGAA